MYDNREMRYDREDILGVIKPERIPGWAKARLLEEQKRNRLNLNDKEATELATKLQKVSALSHDTMNRLTHSIDEWLRF